jgi:hypothetical protein
VTYSTGGQGNYRSSGTDGASAADNTGNGGDGGAKGGGTALGGTGGSGIVIVRYVTGGAVASASYSASDILHRSDIMGINEVIIKAGRSRP